jgi:AraC-like DNA-binding protein
VSRSIRELSALPLNQVHHFRTKHGGLLSGAVETATSDRSYHWDGLKRGDASQPAWLFQYTLKGHGLFQSGHSGSVQKVPRGRAFCAKLPSANMYRGDSSCREWRFFWIMVRDAHITPRLLAHFNLVNCVQDFPPDSLVIHGASHLLTHLVRGDALDAYQMEEHLFRWMLECERWADHQRHPVQPKTKLLESVRRHVLATLPRAIRTSDLASSAGVSRSNYTHHFHKTTGHTPAAYILGLRLEEAARQLRCRQLSVKEVAAATGFTSSNHLCKCFRRHFQMSPGNFRRLHFS